MPCISRGGKPQLETIVQTYHHMADGAAVKTQSIEGLYLPTGCMTACGRLRYYTFISVSSFNHLLLNVTTSSPCLDCIISLVSKHTHMYHSKIWHPIHVIATVMALFRNPSPSGPNPSFGSGL